MTVKKLIKILETYPQNAKVFTVDCNGEDCPLELKHIYYTKIVDENRHKEKITIGSYY